MNNEPVAELLVNDGEPWGCRYSDEGTLFNADGSRMDGWIPLYTHPVKELTDEEIDDMVCSGEYWELSEGQVIIAVHFDKFAKAILRKAQEK